MISVSLAFSFFDIIFARIFILTLVPCFFFTSVSLELTFFVSNNKMSYQVFLLKKFGTEKIFSFLNNFQNILNKKYFFLLWNVKLNFCWTKKKYFFFACVSEYTVGFWASFLRPFLRGGIARVCYPSGYPFLCKPKNYTEKLMIELSYRKSEKQMYAKIILSNFIGYALYKRDNLLNLPTSNNFFRVEVI